ncbi:hypothetical protein [Natrinema sp. 74]|uniref:hypothetical protein n=1 Tax=Natrinema sp. 74 TaxID=3384159 RepID=UPI0038D3B929
MVRKPEFRSRRNVLKAIGTGTALTGLSTVGSARTSEIEKFKERIQTATKIRRESGVATYKKYLKENGIKTTSSKGRYPFRNTKESNVTDGISTQNIDNIDTSGIDIVMSLSSPSINVPAYYVELYWRYYLKQGTSSDSYGEDPLDTIGFAWKDTCWERAWSGLSETSTSSEYVDYDDDAAGFGSFGFTVNDLDISRNTGYGDNGSCAGYSCETYSDYYWGGVYLNARNHPDCYDDSDTRVLGIYDHTWSGTYSKFGVTASFPKSIGITYTTSSYVDSESTTTEDDGSSSLVVSK